MKTIRRLLPLLIAVLLLGTMLLSVSADDLVLYDNNDGYTDDVPAESADALPRLIDQAGLLTENEAARLKAQLDEFYAERNFEITVVTVNSLEGYDVVTYADNLYDASGWSRDGILLLISMDEREWAMSTSGTGIGIFGDNDLAYMEDCFLPYLSRGDYASAFTEYADRAAELVDFAYEYGHDLDENGYWYEETYPYDYDSEPREADPAKTGIISAIVGAFTALFSAGGMKSKMKSVHAASDATRYMSRSGPNITRANEVFLYSNVARTLRSSERSSGGSSYHGGGSFHTSSSGSSHGGSHGHF